MRVALVQLCGSDDPSANLPITEALIREAAAGGARLVLTPECTNIVTLSRSLQAERLQTEANDPTLAQLRLCAAEAKVWLLIGSLCLKSDDAADPRFVNRSFLIGPDGEISARYDKIHMFDVELENGEVYRESTAYRAGDKAIMAKADLAQIGMTICYDLRFPQLYRDLAAAGSQILTVPSAFTVPTGRDHWHVLLRARAIETGCFVLAPAQVGGHAATRGKARQTYGHSLAVDPWGHVLADAGEAADTVTHVDLDLAIVDKTHTRLPSLTHSRPYAAVERP
ncbi:MAG: carbon-nitrogen hydrolase family protein [Pseudomonadota bacterium]